MDGVDDDAVDRIESELDIDIYDEQYGIGALQSEIKNRFTDFTPKQKRGFAEKLHEKQQTTVKPDREILDKMTTLSGKGFDMKRHPMVRDSTTGKYIGARKNIVVTSRQGTRIFVKNTKTGKIGRIQ